jgi:hypothetical protein
LFARVEDAERYSLRVFNAEDVIAGLFQTFYVWLPSACASGASIGIFKNSFLEFQSA